MKSYLNRCISPHTPRRRFFSAPAQAALAQLVEHVIRNDGVTCSSHVSGTILFILRFSAIARLIVQTINLISRFRDVNPSPLVLQLDFAYLSLSTQEETE